MPTALRDRSAIYASRLFSRRRIDVRARVVALHSMGEHGVAHRVSGYGVKYSVVHARTVDVSRSGAGLTLTRELPAGTEVVLCFRIPGNGTMLCLHSVVTRGYGFRVGLRFVQPTAEQRLLLSELCHSCA
jgi:hypothetical protein